VTEFGNLIFGKNDNMALVFTSRDDPDFQLVICKYRFIYDIYLLYQSAGCTVMEYPIDDCPACVTVPASKAPTGKVAGPEQIEPETGIAETLTPLRYFYNYASSAPLPHMRQRSMSEKRHKHKSVLHRQHPLQHGRASRLQRLVAHKVKDKQRWRNIQHDRKLK
jgi:hypothetical protein